jgi:hypothetical protein
MSQQQVVPAIHPIAALRLAGCSLHESGHYAMFEKSTTATCVRQKRGYQRPLDRCKRHQTAKSARCHGPTRHKGNVLQTYGMHVRRPSGCCFTVKAALPTELVLMALMQADGQRTLRVQARCKTADISQRSTFTPEIRSSAKFSRESQNEIFRYSATLLHVE